VPPSKPNSDCFFYKPAWQRLLVATQPRGGTAFLGYPSLDDLFSPLSSSVNQHGLGHVIFECARAPRLLEICEDRCQVRSTILTWQLPVSRWHEQIGDPTLADGNLDRLLHNAHRIEMRGDSRRKNRGKPSG
jgi:DNA replication protein DnaC